MIPTRSLSLFFLLLLSFGLSVFASPIVPTTILPPSVAIPNKLIPYADQHCGCDHDLLDILVNLQVDLEVFVSSLDGNSDPTEACNGIIAAIDVAVKLIVDLKIGGPLLNVKAIVNVLVAIIVSIVGGCGKYGGEILIKLVLALDLHLARLVSSCYGLIPSLLGLVVSLLDSVGYDLLVLLQFLQTILACGLGL